MKRKIKKVNLRIVLRINLILHNIDEKNQRGLERSIRFLPAQQIELIFLAILLKCETCFRKSNIE
jgi:hypothetical protein